MEHSKHTFVIYKGSEPRQESDQGCRQKGSVATPVRLSREIDRRDQMLSVECGDGLCDQSERFETCPEDCDEAPSEPTPNPDAEVRSAIGTSLSLRHLSCSTQSCGSAMSPPLLKIT